MLAMSIEACMLSRLDPRGGGAGLSTPNTPSTPPLPVSAPGVTTGCGIHDWIVILSAPHSLSCICRHIPSTFLCPVCAIISIARLLHSETSVLLR